MRKYRGKRTKTPCLNCMNYRVSGQQCSISKSKHQFNFFGTSMVDCLDFGRVKIGKKNTQNIEKIEKLVDDLEKQRAYFNFYGYNVSDHFIKRMQERKIHRSKIIEAIQMALTHGKIINKIDYKLIVAKAHKCFGLTILSDIKTGKLITVYQGVVK